PYEKKHGALSRPHQAAIIYLFQPSTDIYTCPLAMTDGAARTLLAHGNQGLVDRAVPRLTSRDPRSAWTSGQWMTERTGGSDVGLTETVARKIDGHWRLFGTKWFTSAATSEMSLTLARPEGNGPGGRGLALFYLETRDANGRLNGIQINRLKDKLGTRKLPTAELTLDGTIAHPVVGLTDGIRNITPMLNITRTWNAIAAVGGMRRALALARDYGRRRVAFGSPLAQKPLHLETLSRLQAEFEGAFQMAFFAAELLGLDESGTMTDFDARLQRLVTPLAKLSTAKQAVALSSEVLEVFGGAGYVEDTGVPVILRDAQVLPIWEGTTNVLSLDSLRAIQKEDALPAFAEKVQQLASTAKDARLAACGKQAVEAVGHAIGWITDAVQRDPALVEAGARSFAMTLARALQLALLVRHAQWSIDHEKDGRAALAARRFAQNGIDLLSEAGTTRADAQLLADEAPVPV
ncbi:MAG: acyl-CoA dehydrogenase family protein, partial [Myxococcales bacterium]